MELSFLAKNDAEHYLSELELFRKHHRELRGVFLIQDGGSSHIAGGSRGSSPRATDGGDLAIRPPMPRG